MLGQQRQTVDVKPLPPTPSKTFEEMVGNDNPRCARNRFLLKRFLSLFVLMENGYPSSRATSDQKETSGLFKKLANKLRSPVATQFNTTQTSPNRSSTIRAKAAPPLTNDFTSKENREAALRERGLIATPKKDLSQLEQDLDQKYAKVSPIPGDQTTKDGQQTAAEKIRQEWKAKNQAGRV